MKMYVELIHYLSNDACMCDKSTLPKHDKLEKNAVSAIK